MSNLAGFFKGAPRLGKTWEGGLHFHLEVGVAYFVGFNACWSLMIFF
jgi:hypothetical protein